MVAGRSLGAAAGQQREWGGKGSGAGKGAGW